MFTVEISNPLRGCAYQILFERSNPQNCATAARKAAIAADFANVLDWAVLNYAAEQPASDKHVQDVLAAYRWASESILADIDKRLSINAMHQDVQAAMETFPRPPK